MTPQEVDTVSEIFRCCFVGAGCLHCPLNKDDYEGDCAAEAGDKVFEALNRLRKLETPTEIEQPELPGMEKCEKISFMQLCKKHGYSLRKLSSASCVSDKCIRSYAKGKTYPIKANLVRISEVLGVSEKDVMDSIMSVIP